MRLTCSVMILTMVAVGCRDGGNSGDGDAGSDVGSVILDIAPVQAAIAAAKAGDMVTIAPGRYRPGSRGEAMLVVRAAQNGITIRGGGTSPADVVLDGNGEVLHVVFLDRGIDRTTVIENLTITGGHAYPETVLPAGYTPVLRPELETGHDFYHDGAGVMAFECAPTIRSCRIVDNQAERCGAGISVFRVGGDPFPAKGPLIINNEISDNLLSETFGGTGGGIDVYFDAAAEIVNNLLTGNRGWGGAVAVLGTGSAVVDFCTVAGNRGTLAGIAVEETASLTLTNSIFADNLESAALKLPNSYTFANCAFWSNAEPWDPPAGQGHVTADPLFVTGPHGNYYLSQTATGQSKDSPCVDAGSTSAAAAGLDTRTTRTDGVADSGTVDMGYHYQR